MITPVNYRIDDGVAWLTLNRPDVHNAFDSELISALVERLEETSADPNVRALVLTGNGASFSAGADLNWMRRMAAASEAVNLDDARDLAALMRTLREIRIPTVARVNGAAFGGGVGLVACCDIAIGVESARFGLTEVRLGLVPAAISPHVVDAIGFRQASRYFLTGEIFDADTAVRIGLLHHVVASDALDDAIQAQLKLLRYAGPIAAREAKALLLRLFRADSNDTGGTDEDNAQLIARLRVSPEGQEGLAAFLDKRKPNWI